MAIKMKGDVRGMGETPRQKRKEIIHGLDNVVLLAENERQIVPVHNSASCHKDIRIRGGINPCIPNFGRRLEFGRLLKTYVSHTHTNNMLSRCV
jgi:hypothetical protein